MNIKKCVFFFGLILILSQNGQAGVGDWTTFTSQTDIHDLILIDDHVWCATNGGVFNYQKSTGLYQQFNNTNGLTSIDARAMAIDSKGNIWVGFTNGWINYFEVASHTWKYVQDYVGHPIYSLATIGDSVLVAFDLGLSLYDARRHEVKETYKHLGWQLPGGMSVTDVIVINRDIWAATSSGIAKSSFNLANLMAPESWTNYTTSHGLPSNQINSLLAHNDSIYAGTDSGTAVLRNSSWVTLNNGLDVTAIRKLISKNGFLYSASLGYVSCWNPEENRWRNVAPWLPVINSFTVGENGDLWVARQKSGSSQGFARFSITNQNWELYTPPGPPSNEFTGLAVDKNGILWCASPHDGIFKFEGGSWRQFTTTDGLINNGIKSVNVDARNRKWFGSIGGGLIMIDESEKITVFYNETLSGIHGTPDWVVVLDAKADRYNNIWVLNSFADDQNVVAVYTPQLDWYYFSVGEGILSDVVTSLDFDQGDRLWIGTQAGVTVLDYKNTIADKSDDVIRDNNLTTADGLQNNSIKAIAVDQDNIVWIATEAGLNYWDPKNPEKALVQDGLLSNTINTINIDIRNNKWFGTTAGVSMLANDGYTWTHYSTENSPLVSDNVTAVGFDFETGKVYIGTTNGLSCLETSYSRPRQDLNQVKAGPNPFIIDRDQKFAFSELSDEVSIKFLTENGMVVRQIPKQEILGSYATWDGKNDSGEYVASGIYIYVIFNEDTRLNRVGKVAVIR